MTQLAHLNQGPYPLQNQQPEPCQEHARVLAHLVRGQVLMTSLNEWFP